MVVANEELDRLAYYKCDANTAVVFEGSKFFVKKIALPQSTQFRFTNGIINIAVGIDNLNFKIVKELTFAKIRKTTDDSSW